MTKFIEVSGKTEEEAIASGLAELGLSRDDVSVEIIERAKSGFFGIGGNPAQVRLSYEVADVVPPAAGTQGERVEQYLRGLLGLMGIEADIEISAREGGGVNAMGSYVPNLLAKTMETVKEVTGVDLAEMMKAETYDAKVNRNINITGINPDDAVKVDVNLNE